MDYSNIKFKTVESHTAGEPTRVVLSGFPEYKCGSMMQLKSYYEKNFDHYRSMLMEEPRGHKDMVGAIITRPIQSQADVGVIYFDATRWINMCGHATIGVTTVLINEKLVEIHEPFTTITLDTPAGLVRVSAEVKNGIAQNVTFQNIPSYLCDDNLLVTLCNGKQVRCAVAYSGSFFALADVHDLGLDISTSNIGCLIDIAKEIIAKLNGMTTFKHPTENIQGVENIEFYEASSGSVGRNESLIWQQGRDI